MYFDVFIAKAKKKKKDGDWGDIEIPQSLKYLPCKHEDLNSILCIHMKTLLWQHVPAILGQGRVQRQMHLEGSLAKQSNLL